MSQPKAGLWYVSNPPKKENQNNLLNRQVIAYPIDFEIGIFTSPNLIDWTPTSNFCKLCGNTNVGQPLTGR